MLSIAYTIGTVKSKQTASKKQSVQKQLHRNVKLAVVPHKANQYRPHLIRRYGIAAVLLLAVGFHGAYNAATTGSVLGQGSDVTMNQLLADTNQQRMEHNIAPLELDTKLNQAAFLKAKDMFKNQYWAHTSPDGTTPWKWFGDAGYNYSDAGENLAKNFRTTDAVTTAWMASSAHRANLLGDEYTQVGFAVVDGVLDEKPTTVIVAMYGQPASSGVAGVATAAETSAPGTAQSLGPLTRLGVAVQSMTPALLGSLLLLATITGVAVLAHTYRQKLPKNLRQSWYRHHGIVKAGGMMSLMIVMIALYSGGQI